MITNPSELEVSVSDNLVPTEQFLQRLTHLFAGWYGYDSQSRTFALAAQRNVARRCRGSQSALLVVDALRPRGAIRGRRWAIVGGRGRCRYARDRYLCGRPADAIAVVTSVDQLLVVGWVTNGITCDAHVGLPPAVELFWR